MTSDNLLPANLNYGCILLNSRALSALRLLISMYWKLHRHKIICLCFFLSLTQDVCLSSLPAKNREQQKKKNIFDLFPLLL